MRLKLKSNPLLRKFDRIAGIAVLALLKVFRPKRSLLPTRVRNILLVRFAAMGDTLLMIPAIRAIKQKYPDAEIDFLASNINYSVVEYCPYLNRKYKFEFSKKISKLKGNLRLLSRLRSNGYDIVIDFEPFVRFTALFSLLLKGRYTIGFKTEKQYKHIAFDSFVSHSGMLHEVDNLLSLSAHIGCGCGDRNLELWIPDDTGIKIDSLFVSSGISNSRKVVIHPATGGENHPRQWPIEHYNQLAAFLLSSFDIQIILIGGKTETAIAESISKINPDRIISLAGLTDLFGTIEIIKRANFFISGNTGTMHIASALNIPLLAFHGPTDPARFGPLGINSHVIKSGLHCSPCLDLGFEYGCDKYPCMNFITPGMVIEYIKLINPL